MLLADRGRVLIACLLHILYYILFTPVRFSQSHVLGVERIALPSLSHKPEALLSRQRPASTAGESPAVGGTRLRPCATRVAKAK
jgi:hypothetical protein